MPPRHASTGFRLAALLVAMALLAGCTREVARPAIETRHFGVDWEHSAVEALPLDGLTLRGIVLTPAQWPLEGSLKRLLASDFIGVIDALDLRFHSSTVPGGVLREIYDAGFLPVYARVTNTTSEPRGFFPQRLTVQGEPGRVLYPVEAQSLPQHLRRMDWERTAVVTLAALVLVAVLVAGREGRLDARSAGDVTDLSARVIVAPCGTRRAGGAGRSGAEPAPPADPGVLAAGLIAPGETRQGFIFFAHRGEWVDWKTAQLAVP